MAQKVKQVKKAPACPDCGKPLVRVWETVYETYTFNPKTGSYETNDFHNEQTVKCSECGADLRDIFEEGACNFDLDEYLKKEEEEDES